MDRSLSTDNPPENAARMLFVQRDQNGAIHSVRNTADAQHREGCTIDQPELREYLQLPADQSSELYASDTDLVRVIEDLVDVLIEKQIISFTDLPAAAQDKLLRRRQLRNAITDYSLLDESNDSI